MLLAILRKFRRLGFIGALLMALATVAAPLEGLTMEPAGVRIAADIACADSCDLDDCGDCASGCVHGCCHAPHSGIVGVSPTPPAVMAVRAPRTRLERSLPPSLAPPGLDRPPRA
jgi:hypothetical protein